MKKESEFREERLTTPTGAMVIVTDDAGDVRAADWETHGERMTRLIERYYGRVVLSPRKAPPSRALSALRAYFEGDLCAIERVTVARAGTPFQAAVWAALRRIPPGTTLSYAALAAKIGRKRAVRAVGAANGANPIAIVVPCHRVIGKSGALTGYGGGVDRKEWLLSHERA